jgi:hypothetical protein
MLLTAVRAPSNENLKWLGECCFNQEEIFTSNWLKYRLRRLHYSIAKDLESRGGKSYFKNYRR